METERVELTPKEVEKQVEALLTRKNISPEYLKLYCELFTTQYRTEQKLRLSDIYPAISKVEIKRRLEAGVPVIEPEKLQIPEAALAGHLERVIPILAKYATNAASFAWTLLDASRAGKLKLADLVRALVSGDEEYLEKTADELGCGAGEVIFIVSILARPALRRLARSLTHLAPVADIASDRCPICSSAPLMATIRRDDNKRVLECSLCGTTWGASRLRCLACGNQDDATLGFLFLDEEACRIDKCEKCHAYIKTLDERKKPEDKATVLSLEDAATLYLDMLAEGKGYHSLR